MFASIFNNVYSIGILVVIFVSFITLLALAFFRKDKNPWLTYIKKNALNLYLTLLVTATIGSLYYSEIAKYTPCKLCWWQRLFIFPQLIVGFISKSKKSIQSADVWNYLTWMTGLAMFFSLVHNYVYYFGKENSVTCDAAASCKAFYIYLYDLVTIPFMALGLLFSLVTIILVRKYYIGDEKN